MTSMEKGYLFWLMSLEELGAVSIQKMFCMNNSYQELYNIEGKELTEIGILSKNVGAKFEKHKQRLGECLENFGQLEEMGINFVECSEKTYPQKLRDIYASPVGLFYKGKLPDPGLPAVAIVGARNCTEYGKQVAEHISSILSREQVQIISGLAHGIDGAAHRGALECDCPTFGVLGCGVDQCYPSYHFPLYQKMVQGCGGILSEFVPGTNPLSYHFPMRNRIISGLSDAVIVIEAKEKSGSLITAELGLEQGKDIFAVPGRMTDRLSQGCNLLIKHGAYVLTTPEDVIQSLGIRREKKLKVREKDEKSLAKSEKMVYANLDFQPKHLDWIANQSGLSVSECMGILLELELKGYAVETTAQYYEKKLSEE